MGHKREDWREVEYLLTEEDVEKMYREYEQEREKQEWKKKNC
jgi:hypothetical protein